MVGGADGEVVRVPRAEIGAAGDTQRQAASARAESDAVADLLNPIEDCRAWIERALRLLQERRKLVGDIAPIVAHRLLDAHARLGEAHQLLGFPRGEGE